MMFIPLDYSAHRPNTWTVHASTGHCVPRCTTNSPRQRLPASSDCAGQYLRIGRKVARAHCRRIVRPNAWQWRPATRAAAVCRHVIAAYQETVALDQSLLAIRTARVFPTTHLARPITGIDVVEP